MKRASYLESHRSADEAPLTARFLEAWSTDDPTAASGGACALLRDPKLPVELERASLLAIANADLRCPELNGDRLHELACVENGAQWFTGPSVDDAGAFPDAGDLEFERSRVTGQIEDSERRGVDVAMCRGDLAALLMVTSRHAPRDGRTGESLKKLQKRYEYKDTSASCGFSTRACQIAVTATEGDISDHGLAWCHLSVNDDAATYTTVKPGSDGGP